MSKNQYCQKMGFLGVIVESKELNVFPPQGKVSEIIEQCQLFLARDQVSMREFSRLVGKLCYSSILVLPAPLITVLLKGNRLCVGKSGKIAMMGHQSEVKQWAVPSNCKSTNDISNRCVRKTLGPFANST